MGKSITVVIAAPFAPASLGLALVSALPRWRVDAFGGGRYVSVVPLLLVSYFVSIAALLLLDTGNRKEHKGKDDDAMPPQAKVHPLQAVPDAPTGQAAKPRRRDSLAGLGHDELVDRSALAERELDVRRAAELLHLAHNLDPECHSTRLQLCKVRCDLGFLIFDVSNGGPMTRFFECREGETAEAATKLVTSALAGARDLVSGRPDCHQARTLLALCIGRSILVETKNRRKVHLAKEMHDAAMAAVSLNSEDDQAHFMLARWHNDIASLPGVLKTLVRFVYGTGLKGSFERAVECSKTAIALNPGNLVNKVELGRAYTGLGNLESAKRVYEQVLDLEVLDVNSALYKQIALDDIGRMERGEPVGSLARPWWAVG